MKYYFIVSNKRLHNIEVIEQPSRRALIKYLAEARREDIKLFSGVPIAILTEYQWKQSKGLLKTTFSAVSKLIKGRFWLK